MTDSSTNLASRWKRLGGGLIDSMVGLVLIIPISFFTGIFKQILNGQKMTFGQEAILLGIGLLVFLILHGYLLYTRGQTIGKVVVKTKIVDLDGKLPSFGNIFVLRYLILVLVAQIPVIGNLIAIVNALFIFGRERRCLHDYIAGTRVVNI